jgi:hypothetical protein
MERTRVAVLVLVVETPRGLGLKKAFFAYNLDYNVI